MDHYHNFLVGIVVICPMTKKQTAIHRDSVTFEYWNADLAGHEVEIKIDLCPSCNTKHSVSVPLQHWG